MSYCEMFEIKFRGYCDQLYYQCSLSRVLEKEKVSVDDMSDRFGYS